MSRHASSSMRVGLAGLGTMGRNHLRNLLARDDVTLAAVADPAAAALAAALEVAGADVPAFEDPLEMIRQGSMDALIVAAPTTRHFQVAVAAISSGIPVLVEKPLAATIIESEQLIRLSETHGVILQVGHIERFNPAVVALSSRLRRGDLSRIYSIKTVRGGPLPDRIRDVGVAIDLATHDVDIMCHLVGERPIRVSAERARQIHTAHEDLLYGLLSFPSGVIGLIDVNWLTPEKQRRIVVLGAEGMFQVDYLAQSLTFTRGAQTLSPAYLDGYAPTFVGETVSLPVEPAEPLRLEQDAFLATVRDGGRPQVSGSDGHMALAIAKRLLAAADEGRSLEVPQEITREAARP